MDGCDPQTGCTEAFNTDPCDDGSECTDNDVCGGGTCQGDGLVCDDENPCTDDTCSVETGCVFTANDIGCDDGDACTDQDVCADKACAGAAITCDDGNLCTGDTCDPQTGCVFTANAEACDDGDACTDQDTCADKACAGAAITCDDGNLCTGDTCDPQTGCVFTANAEACDDGDACTDQDTCADKACAGAAITCDDDNPCTADSCQAGECAFVPDDSVTVGCYNGPATTAGVGACKTGQQACSGGSLGPCEGAVEPATELCGNGMDDDCDDAIDELECAALGVDLSLAEVEMALTVGSPGLLSGVTTSLGDGAFGQGVTALQAAAPASAGAVVATVGPLSATSPQFTTPTLPATWLRAIVRTTDAWADQPTIRALVQARDALGRAPLAPQTTATLVATAADQAPVTSTCTLGADGTCDIALDAPAAWFSATAPNVIEVHVTLGALSTEPTPVTLAALPSHAPPPAPGVLATLPLGPRLPQTTFSVPLVAYTPPGEALESFDITLSHDPAVLTVTAVVAHPSYTGASNAKPSGETVLVGVRDPSVGLADVTGAVPLGTITYQVLPGAPAGATSAVSGTVAALFNVQNVSLLPTGTPIQIDDGAGSGTSGTTGVADNPVRGIYALVAHTQLFVTSAFDSAPVESPIAIRAARTVLPDEDVSAAAACESSHPDRLIVAAGCVATADASTTEAGAATVTAALDAQTATANLHVWQPQLPPVVTVADPTLNAVEGWLDADCAGPRFQATRARAEATFEDGQGAAIVARIDHLLALESTAPGVVAVEGDRLVGLTPGTAMVGGVEVVVTDSAVGVDGLDVVVVTGVTVAPLAAPAGGDPFGLRTAEATLFQLLDAEGKTSDVLVYARFSDGARAALSPADGLALASKAPKALSVTQDPPGVIALESAAGPLVEASWTVCDSLLGVGFGNVVMTLPAPTGATAVLSAPRLAVSDQDPAHAAGVVAQTQVTTTLEYENGTSADFTLDERTEYDDTSGDPSNLFVVTVGDDGVTVAPTGNGTGEATLVVTFTHAPGLSATATVSVVKHESFTLVAHPWPAFAGSDAIEKTTLSPIEATGAWQQAALDLDMVLTDGFTIDLSTHAGTAFQAAPALATIAGPNIVTASAPGTTEITAGFAGASSAPLALLIGGPAVMATQVTTTFPATFAGLKDTATAKLGVAVTLSDGTVLPNALAVSGLVELTSDAPDKASITADGTATLHDNHNLLVGLTATATSSQTSGTSLTACNLTPDVGDVDLGQPTGLPHPDVGPGELFGMPVRINTGGAPLGSMDITITYDPAVIQAIGGEPGPEWPGGQLEVTVNDPPGQVHIVAAAAAGTTAAGAALHVVDIGFKGLKGDDPTTLVAGHVTKLLDNAIDQAPIGALLGPGETRPIVAGRGLLDPDCPDGTEPADVLGNTNGDCELSVGDVSYSLFYLADLVDEASVEPFQTAAMDTDQDGDIDVADAVYLLRILANKFRFVALEVVPPGGLGGTLHLGATLRNAAGLPAPTQATVYFELSTQANADLTATTGAIAEATASGVLLQAAPQGDGTWIVEATGFSAPEAGIGVVVIVETTDTLGETSVDRIVALHGTPWLNELSDFEPAATFDIVQCTTAQDCDDTDTCTADTCEGAAGCVHTPLDTPECTPSCAPAHADTVCLGGDLAWTNACGDLGPVAIDCDDADPCTLDTCDAAEKRCVYNPTGGTACAGEGCEEPSKLACVNGHLTWTACGAPIAIAEACDDADDCTADVCDASTTACATTGLPDAECPALAPGCELAPATACLDGDVVWLDACGKAFAAAELCDDGDPETVDACDEAPTPRCTHTPVEAPPDAGPEATDPVEPTETTEPTETAEPTSSTDTHSSAADTGSGADAGSTTLNAGGGDTDSGCSSRPGGGAPTTGWLLVLGLLLGLAIRRRAWGS